MQAIVEIIIGGMAVIIGFELLNGWFRFESWNSREVGWWTHAEIKRVARMVRMK